MPTGIKPGVNEAKEFLEIAKNFRDSKEIIREALPQAYIFTVTLRLAITSNY